MYYLQFFVDSIKHPFFRPNGVIHVLLLPLFWMFVFAVTDMMLERDPNEEVQKAFKLFDDDESGKISLRNLRRVAR